MQVIGVDFDNTFVNNMGFFKHLLMTWDDYYHVFFLSSRQRLDVIADLWSFGVHRHLYTDVLSVLPARSVSATIDYRARASRTLHEILFRNIQVYFDDCPVHINMFRSFGVHCLPTVLVEGYNQCPTTIIQRSHEPISSYMNQLL